jgi:hypothetical protein
MIEALALIDWGALEQDGVACFAEKQPPLDLFETVHAEPFADAALALRPGLLNFQEVAQGEVLSAANSPVLRSPRAGYLMFPKYPARDELGRAISPYPREIFRVVNALRDSGRSHYGST